MYNSPALAAAARSVVATLLQVMTAVFGGFINHWRGTSGDV
jgi:hypothetical protein